MSVSIWVRVLRSAGLRHRRVLVRSVPGPSSALDAGGWRSSRPTADMSRRQLLARRGRVRRLGSVAAPPTGPVCDTGPEISNVPRTSPNELGLRGKPQMLAGHRLLPQHSVRRLRGTRLNAPGWVETRAVAKGSGTACSHLRQETESMAGRHESPISPRPPAPPSAPIADRTPQLFATQRGGLRFSTSGREDLETDSSAMVGRQVPDRVDRSPTDLGRQGQSTRNHTIAIART